MDRLPTRTAPPTAAEEGSDWHRPARFALLLGLLIVASFPNEVLGLGTFFFRDFGYFTLPLAHHHRASFWAGEVFPLWNPLSNAGAPFLAQWSTLTLYPGSLIYLLIPLPWGLNLFMLAHLFLGGLGMYRLMERWTGHQQAAALAGVAFAFNGMVLNSLMWSNYIASFGWMPWTVLLVERAWREGGRRLLLAALVGALQMLSATPEIILFTWLLLAAMFVGQAVVRGREEGWGTWLKAGARFASVVAMVSALAAIQLLPFLDLLARSQRDSGYGDGSWAMPPWGWANMIVPLFHTFSAHQGVHFQPTQFWTSSYYPGIVVVALALGAVFFNVSRRAAFLAAIALVCLILALGDAGLVYGGLRKVLPIAGFMRFPIKFIMLPAFLLPCLAAFAVASPERMGWTGPGRNRRGLVGLIVVLLAVIGALVGWAMVRPWPGEIPARTAWNGLGRAAFLLATAVAFSWQARAAVAAARGTMGRSDGGGLWVGALRQLLPLLLVWADVMTHAPSQNPTAAAWVFDADVQQLRPGPRPGESRAMISAQAHAEIRPASIDDPNRDVVFKRQALFDNGNLLDGIPKVDGMFSLYLREHDHIRTLLYGATNVFRPRLMDFLGVSHVTAPGELVKWQVRATALPLVTAGQAVVEADEATMLAALGGEVWDPAQTVYVAPGAGGGGPGGRAERAQAKLAHFSAHRLEIEVSTPAPTVVVIAQTWHPNWRARIEGQEVPLIRANHAFQAVAVSAGNSRLVLTYEDPRFRLGAALSGPAWLLLLGALGLAKAARRSLAPPCRR